MWDRQHRPVGQNFLDPVRRVPYYRKRASVLGGRLRIALIGGTGMLGSWLADVYRDRGWDVVILTRGEPTQPDQIQWTLSRGISDVRRLEGLHAVVNLAGAPIADRPWTRMRRETLRRSRIQTTKVILQSLARLDDPPKIYVGAGHLGIYGDRGDKILDESDEPGAGFLAELSQAWEEVHFSAEKELGARVAVLRMAVSLSPTGGVLPLMLQPFRIGMGGWLGDGRQYTSWIGVRDTMSAFEFLIDNKDCRGVFNGTVPEPSRNKEWCRSLGRVLNRPVLANAPRWALRGALGELADNLFLASIRAVPGKLLRSGFRFEEPHIEPAFGWMVKAIEEQDPTVMRHRPARRAGGRRGRAGRIR